MCVFPTNRMGFIKMNKSCHQLRLIMQPCRVDLLQMDTTVGNVMTSATATLEGVSITQNEDGNRTRKKLGGSA